MKNILFAILSIFIFTSCIRDNEIITEEPADRTVLAYFLTSGLTSDLENNLIGMFEGLQETKSPSTVLIFWDNKSKVLTYPSIIRLSSDGKGNVNNISKDEYANQSKYSKFDYIISQKMSIIHEYKDDLDVTDKDVITSVISDMISLSPTKSYGLIFGSHATSWLPIYSARSSRVLASAGYSDPIDIPELNYALINVGKKFDFILMDACMMGNVEVVYEIQNVCDYYIASPMEVPSQGFPYSVITPYFFDGKLSANLQKICDSYCDFQSNTWGNCVAVKCDELTSLTQMIKGYVNSYSNSNSNIDLTSVQHYYKNEESFKESSFDILDFINKISNNSPSSSFITQLNNTLVAKSFVKNINTNPYPSFSDVDDSKLCGLGMYIPVSNHPNWNLYLKNLLWYEDSGWGTYIEKNNL